MCCQIEHPIPLLFQSVGEAQKKKIEIGEKIHQGGINDILLIEPLIKPGEMN